MDYAKHTDGKGRIKDSAPPCVAGYAEQGVDEFLADERAARTAEVLYERRRQDVAALLDWLEIELGHHADYAAKEGVNYGHAGDLGHLREKLVEALSFLAQRDEKDIEDALDDVQAGREQAKEK